MSSKHIISNKCLHEYGTDTIPKNLLHNTVDKNSVKQKHFENNY